MKIQRLILILLTGSAILIPGCKKHDSEESLKEVQIFKMTGDISADSLESFDNWLIEMDTRFALASNNREVAKAIEQRFVSMGFSDTGLDSFQIIKVWKDSTFEKTEYNVIATLEGSSGSDSISIIGGHYDDITGTGDPLHYSPGANDNGSGVSAVLEVARVMMKNRFTPRETIKFIAFAAEEQGLLGSYDFAAKARDSGLKIRFMLNNDMVAHEPGSDRKAWYVDIMDYPGSEFLRQEAETICFKYSILKPYNNNTYSHYSDSYSFSSRGYKALFFFASAPDPYYHTINDLLSNCNFDYCREVAKVNCAILAVKN